MTTKADIKRVRLSLQAERLNLRQLALELNEQRRAITRERAIVIAVLRIACERHGDNDWSEDQPLDRIIQEHLLAPVERKIDRRARRIGDLTRQLAESEASARVTARVTPAPQPATARHDPPRPVPRPLRPTPVPIQEHRCVVVRAQDRSGLGHRARCLCGWASATVPDQAVAARDGDLHAQRFAPIHGRERRA